MKLSCSGRRKTLFCPRDRYKNITPSVSSCKYIKYTHGLIKKETAKIQTSSQSTLEQIFVDISNKVVARLFKLFSIMFSNAN